MTDNRKKGSSKNLQKSPRIGKKVDVNQSRDFSRPESTFTQHEADMSNDQLIKLRQSLMIKEVDRDFFLNHASGLPKNLQPIQMAESQAIHAAHVALDSVLDQGSEILYEKYLAPKSRPFAISTVTQILSVWASVSAI